MANAARKARKRAGEKFQPKDHSGIRKAPHNPPKLRTADEEDLFREVVETMPEMARWAGWIR